MKMITVQQAEEILASLTNSWETEILPLEECLGRPLREDLFADRNYPPFHRICMDGIALLSADYQKGLRAFPLQETTQAGAPQTKLLKNGHCIEVMTGCPAPVGCDLNIRYEDLEISEGVAKVIAEIDSTPGKNIHPEGTDFKKGEHLLSPGILINPTHIAIAASIGKSSLRVTKYPKIGVFSTGDELVDIEHTPLPHQIRKSNVHALHGALLQNGFKEVTLFHAQDLQSAIEESLQKALQSHQIILLSGGVSMGKFDSVPQALQNLGVQELFHKVQHRPGKPLWVGQNPEGALVFGLPGNPVSALVCFRRYVLPLLIAKSGLNKQSHTQVVLAEDVHFKPNLTWYLPVTLKSQTPTGWLATPKPTRGSGDFYTLGLSDGFIEIPPGETHFKAGRSFPFYDWHYRL